MRGAAVAALAVLVLAAAAPAEDLRPAPKGLRPAPDGLEARDIARRAEDALRSETTYAEVGMTIESPRLPKPRVVRFRWWDDRPGRRAFIRILAPAKDAGSGFLKIHPNLWMYVPRVERTLRIPPSLMLESWMGSDFTNDDLVRESSVLDDYDHHLLGVDPAPEGAPEKPAYVLAYVPHEDAPVVWGRIVAWVETEHATPLRQDFYDEDGTRLRTMRFSEIREVEGRWFPHRWTMRPLDKEGHGTTVEIEAIRFDEAFDADIFTTRRLQRWR
jgi:outer membrane lipoprotein-sorting protein